MKHYRDITSFHSIGKAISGKPEDINNVVDLLNFLSQVVFCDRIIVSVLGPSEITQGTLDVIEKLELLGLPKGLIEKYSYPEKNDRILQRSRIAERLKFDWIDHFPELGQASPKSFPPGYYDMLKATVDIFSDTLLNGTDTIRYRSEISDSLQDDQVSYMVGLMLADPELVELLRERLSTQNAGQEQLYDFIALSRNKYNLLLAEDLKLIFTPTASRARKNHETAYSFMETYRSELHKDPREEMKKLRLTGKEFQLDIPSALHLLLAQKSTSVTQLIDRALEAREKVTWYRSEVLNDFNDLRFSNSIEDQIKLSNKLDNIYQDVASVLTTNGRGLTKSIFGHFSIDVVNFASASGSIKAVSSFLQYVNNVRKLKRHKESYLLTQELIHYMSKDNNEYKTTVQRLFVALGGSFNQLIK